MARAYRFSQIFVFLAVISESYFKVAHSAGRVVWSKDRNDFIPVESIAAFLNAGKDRLEKSRALEHHDFQKEVLKIAFFPVPNVMDLHNDSRISGAIGETWNLVAEYANFTLAPVWMFKTGEQLPNGSYDGAIGSLFRNELQIIAGSGLQDKLDDVSHLIPFAKIEYSLYIRSSVQDDRPEIFHMFPPIVWSLIFIMFILLSVVGYMAQKTMIRLSRERTVGHSFCDHLFYTFGVLCGQGFIPDSLYRHTKIISFTKAMFAFIILATASSQLVSDTSNQAVDPPFYDLRSMFTTTNYSLIVNIKGSTYTVLQKQYGSLLNSAKYSGRIINIEDPSSSYEKICQPMEKLALLMPTVLHRYFGNRLCRVVPIGEPFLPVLSGATVLKKFKYKKRIDISMLKVMESGLHDRMMKRFLPMEPDEEPYKVEPVDLRQVAVPFAVLGIGMILSIIIFIIEHIVYIYQCNRR